MPRAEVSSAQGVVTERVTIVGGGLAGDLFEAAVVFAAGLGAEEFDLGVVSVQFEGRFTGECDRREANKRQSRGRKGEKPHYGILPKGVVPSTVSTR